MDQQSKDQILVFLNQYAEVFNASLREILLKDKPLDDFSQHFISMFDPDKVGELFSMAMQFDPSELMHTHRQFMQKQAELWQQTTKVMLGESQAEVITESKGDNRFKDQDWQNNPVYHYLKQAYLLNSEMLQNMVSELQFSDPKAEEQMKFYVRQYINSVSPTNHILTNPEVCREIVETNGQNLIKGAQNFLKDLQQSPVDAFRITQTDPNAFTLGENLATTPGKVIFQNDLMQLLQYTPTTEQVFKVPLLITPPFINKYYILDLDKQKSLVRWLVAQGHSVFVVSWVNPESDKSNVDFTDYMEQGTIAALKVVKKISKSRKVNTVGWCVGGTLLSISNAYLAAKKDYSVNSMTLLTTLLDFSQPGELSHYLSDDMLPLIEKQVDQKGVLDGRVLALGFSMLRENNLFWSFFINNYLKGKDPAPFDILYWNSDPTNLPAAFFKQYIHETYRSDNLKKGNLTINGVTIDLSRIKVPSYFLATLADHIVLWQGAYSGTQLVSGSKRFVLAGSGHLAGVINPPEKGKYPHWTNDNLEGSAESWFENADKHEGSWWPDWQNWLAPISGAQIPAMELGQHKDFPVIEDAPGSYVKVRI